MLKITVAALVVLIGCTPYPRYQKASQTNPRDRMTESAWISTNEYIRLGQIIQQYLGKPYKGKSRWDEGLDCSLFTEQVFREFNRRVLPRKAEEQAKEGSDVPRNLLRYGDLVFFRTERSRISHVGIYVDNNQFVHASTSRGVIISNLNEKYWAKRYAGGRRILK